MEKKLFKGTLLQNSNPNLMEIIVESQAEERSLYKKKFQVSIKDKKKQLVLNFIKINAKKSYYNNLLVF